MAGPGPTGEVASTTTGSASSVFGVVEGSAALTATASLVGNKGRFRFERSSACWASCAAFDSGYAVLTRSSIVTASGGFPFSAICRAWSYIFRASCSSRALSAAGPEPFAAIACDERSSRFGSGSEGENLWTIRKPTSRRNPRARLPITILAFLRES